MEEKQNFECPLCMEEFDDDEINFFPCTCQYQICKFCWNKIQSEENGKCPACRKIYSEEKVEFKICCKNNKKNANRKQNKKNLITAEEKKYLLSVRVVQKNLIIVTGLSSKLSNAKVLQSLQYFGKYGKINYIYVVASTHSQSNISGKAYITYQCFEDAIKAINSTNGKILDGQKVRVEMGTTSYCTNFLDSIPCKFPECSFMHEMVEKEATFTKEEIRKDKQLCYISDLLKQYESCSNITALASSRAQAPIKRPFIECTQNSSDNNKFFKTPKLVDTAAIASTLSWRSEWQNLDYENESTFSLCSKPPKKLH